MRTALVLSAGGLWAAWEVGAWKVLRAHYTFDLVVGASAGAWNGWAIAGGCTPDELTRDWMNPLTGRIMQPGLHSTGVLLPGGLHQKSRDLFARFQPRIPFGLTMVEVPSMRLHLVRDSQVTWQHLAASCAIPLGFPPVSIAGKHFVDGGLRGGLPLWAAEQMGATRAVALNVLSTPLFHLLQRTMRGVQPGSGLEVIRLEPSVPLGRLRDALRWSAGNIERWIHQGELDAKKSM